MGFRIITPKRIRKVKSKNSLEVLRRLEEYLESAAVTGEPIEILCGFWKDQQDAITYQELRQAVKDGAISQETLSLWSQDYSVLVANRLNNLWTDAIVAGSTGQPILDGLAFEFNMHKPGILSWISERGAEFVTASIQEQKDAIAALLTKKMRDGHTVDELSRLLRPCIGLTERDAKAAVRLYDSIVSNLKKEHPRMKQESIRRKALDATQKYAERKHRARALTIAQTESAFAYNRGADEGIRQAQSQNLLGIVKKRWCTSGDDAVCPICEALDGVEVGMEGEFPFKGKILFSGHHMLPPAHPRCACAVEYIEIESPKMSPEIKKPDNVNGLSAGNSEGDIENVEHYKTKYLGSLDDVSDDMVKLTLEKYESEIVKSDIENAVVITKSGLVFQCFGNKEGVYPNINLGDELMGASVTHNHPIGSSNEYSFSNDDINLFIDYDLKLLRGIDEKYIYQFSRDPHEIDRLATMEELMDSDGDETRHEKVIDRAKELGIGYRRWKR